MKYLPILLACLFTIAMSAKADDRQLVIACKTESQIFVLSHVWKYHGVNEARKVFASYTNPGDNGEEPVCFLVEVTELYYAHFSYSIKLPNAGWMYSYMVYQSATSTHNNLHVLSDGELFNK